MTCEYIIRVENLRTYFFTEEGVVKAVDGVSLGIRRGRVLCIVGESGSGKSVLARSMLRLIDPPGKIVSGRIIYSENGRDIDLAALPENHPMIRKVRGGVIGYVFQEPFSAFSPVHTIGDQIAEAIVTHCGRLERREMVRRMIALLESVGIREAEKMLGKFAWELSGGQRQRAMIAMAMAAGPKILLADEPTTALDVTTQAQVITLLRSMVSLMDMSVVLITHDMGVVAEIADDVGVMYAGEMIEYGPVERVFDNPLHPYTRGLINAIPRISAGNKRRIDPIPGEVPHPLERPKGCPFHPRCSEAIRGRCDIQSPPLSVLKDGAGWVKCHLYRDDDDGVGGNGATGKLGEVRCNA